MIKKNAVFLIFLLLFSGSAIACSVPVFRYALELWEPNSYRIALFYRDSLTGEERKVACAIAGRCLCVMGDSVMLGPYNRSTVRANAELDLVNLRDTLPEQVEKLWRNQVHPGLPWLSVCFPQAMGNATSILSGKLLEMPVEELFDSPARRAIAEGVSQGASAVWLLLESGNPAKDAAAKAALTDGMQLCKTRLKLPVLDPDDSRDVVEKSPLELKMDFSAVYVSRSDPAERFLARLLERSEPRLEKMVQEPLAFPVFGRGRVLCALAGKGINEANILEAGSFLCGPCACTIKDANPGTDLLLHFDWEGALRGNSIVEQQTAPLSGLGAFMAAPKKSGSSSLSMTPSNTVGNRPGSCPLPRPGVATPQSAKLLTAGIRDNVPVGSDPPVVPKVQRIMVKSEPSPVDMPTARHRFPFMELLRISFISGSVVLLILIMVTIIIAKKKKNR